MIALFDCSLMFRSAMSVMVLCCFVTTCSVIVFSFLKRKKQCFILNAISFVIEFFVLILLNIIAEYKIGNNISSTLLNFSHKPALYFALLSVIAVFVSIYSLIKNKNSYYRIHRQKEDSDSDYLLCQRAEQLQRDNIRLAEMNKQIKLYGEEMQAQIKQKEILHAKTRIHNGMNRLLMISLRAIESGDKSEIEKAVALWHRDALLLCKEAESDENSDIMNDIKALADSLHIKLICDFVTESFDDNTAILFQKSACEAMLNSVKHANADTFEIAVTDDGFVFTNNGALPNGGIRYGGGLTEIKRLAENSGYEMTIECNECFKLILKKKRCEDVI